MTKRKHPDQLVSNHLFPNFKWDEDKATYAIRAWADGQSGGEIAEALGCSRNGVMGKLNRLGVSGTIPDKALAAERKLGGGVLVSIRAKRRASPKPVRAKIPAPQPISNLSLPEFNAAVSSRQRKTIVQLENHDCRFPLWPDGSHAGFYCGGAGADMSERRPYCPYHSKIAGRKYEPKSEIAA